MNTGRAPSQPRTFVALGGRLGRSLGHRATWRICVLSLVLVCEVFPGAASARGFVHPGILHTPQDLEFMKRKVAARAEPRCSAWTTLLRQDTASLNFTGQPSAYLGDRENGNEFEHAACFHALQSAVTGNRAHARRATEIIHVAAAWRSGATFRATTDGPEFPRAVHRERS